MSRIKEVTSKKDWDHQLTSAGGRPVVVDFTAAWCGPCKAVAPVFASLSTKYTQVVFLKVDVDACADIAGEAGVRAMPTFQIYKQRQKVEEIVGADVGKLEGLLGQYNAASSPFTGQGRKLSDQPAAAASLPAVSDSHGQMAAVDESAPTTTLQIRLADGSRITGRFNHSHTIGDVQRYIWSQAGGSAGGVLMTTYPPQPLTDEGKTLEEAGLLNSAIIQRP